MTQRALLDCAIDKTDRAPAEGLHPTIHEITISTELEVQIDNAYRAMVTAGSVITRRAALAKMTRLIAQRSPQQIHRMELAGGFA